MVERKRDIGNWLKRVGVFLTLALFIWSLLYAWREGFTIELVAVYIIGGAVLWLFEIIGRVETKIDNILDILERDGAEGDRETDYFTSYRRAESPSNAKPVSPKAK